MDNPWYKNGLKFKCTECGKCCTGSPGYVFVSHTELEEMSQSLKISLPDFLQKYTRRVHGRIALLERRMPNGDYDCVFLKGKMCTLYNARPKQCRTYPWWKENLSSKEAWEEAAEICEGINHADAPLISLGEIEKGLNSN